MEPDTTEELTEIIDSPFSKPEPDSARLGLLVVIGATFLLPLIIALWLALWSVAAAAWWLLVAQLTGV